MPAPGPADAAMERFIEFATLSYSGTRLSNREYSIASLDSRDPDACSYNKFLAWSGRNPIALLTSHHPDQLEVIELTP